jgi:hypothetical protein
MYMMRFWPGANHGQLKIFIEAKIGTRSVCCGQLHKSVVDLIPILYLYIFYANDIKLFILVVVSTMSMIV